MTPELKRSPQIYVVPCLYHGGSLPCPDIELQEGDCIVCPGCEDEE